MSRDLVTNGTCFFRRRRLFGRRHCADNIRYSPDRHVKLNAYVAVINATCPILLRTVVETTCLIKTSRRPSTREGIDAMLSSARCHDRDTASRDFLASPILRRVFYCGRLCERSIALPSQKAAIRPFRTQPNTTDSASCCAEPIGMRVWAWFGVR